MSDLRRLAGVSVLALALLSPAASTPGEPVAPSVTTSHPRSVPPRPGTESASALTLVGGPAALDPDVTAMLEGCEPDAEVVAGPDRFATAAALADRVDIGADVLVAAGRDFPDALAATPVVSDRSGTLLLTEHDVLPEATREWLAARDVGRVVVLGGTAAVSEAVVDELAGLADEVVRIAGADRFATAAALARTLPEADVVHVASGRAFPDALSLGPVAARAGSPVLLVERDAVPDATAAELRRRAPDEVVVAGGPAAVSDDVLDALADLTGARVRRVAGVDRWATSAALAEELDASTTGALVTSGLGFPDALAAGQLAAVAGVPLLLVGDDVAPPVGRLLDDRRAWSCRSVRVVPSPVEALTLGPSSTGGTVLTVARGDGVAVGVRDASGAGLLLDGADTLRLSYPRAAGGVDANDVVWEQLVDPTQPEVVLEQPWRAGTPTPAQGLTVAWQYTGDSDRYRREVDAAPGLGITAPFRYFLSPDGSLHVSTDAAFIADMHARGLEVWPTIHVGGAAGIEATLSDPGRRADYARRISDDARDKGADGVNIDIEGFGVHLRDEVTDFTVQLSDLVHAWGGVTSFDVTSMTDTWVTPPAGYEFWSTAPDRRAIADAVDWTVLMAYDQFNRFRPRGPVASDAWVEEALRYQLRFSNPDTVLLGLPLYARVWDGGDPTAVGQARLRELVAAGRRVPDPAFGVDRVELPDGRVTWAETSDRLASRLALVDAYGLAGTASWRLGFDDPATWDTLGR